MSSQTMNANLLPTNSGECGLLDEVELLKAGVRITRGGIGLFCLDHIMVIDHVMPFRRQFCAATRSSGQIKAEVSEGHDHYKHDHEQRLRP